MSTGAEIQAFDEILQRLKEAIGTDWQVLHGESAVQQANVAEVQAIRDQSANCLRPLLFDLGFAITQVIQQRRLGRLLARHSHLQAQPSCSFLPSLWLQKIGRTSRSLSSHPNR